ncbi:geranylgeranyl pyrophosphate synthase [Diaporthe amygdali]|uniref:geranylgeranyl pyrophosphate synthase n=1 Tax=Phomopsis amygdali TaxID=1214568 RepID=UPI0022FE4AD0|nr:geranylgeranyl pyrophosphate synthase [Diaporthe amygdali]KAJ0116073.1 geranylgeranyl pyrophosphate synthase [Diaporthe amygdali]
MFSTLKYNDSTTGLETLRVRNRIKEKRRGPLAQNASGRNRTADGTDSSTRTSSTTPVEVPKQQTETQENNDHDHTVDMFFSDMPELDFNLFGGAEMADDSIDPLDTAYHVEERQAVTPAIFLPSQSDDSSDTTGNASNALPISGATNDATMLEVDVSPPNNISIASSSTYVFESISTKRHLVPPVPPTNNGSCECSCITQVLLTYQDIIINLEGKAVNPSETGYSFQSAGPMIGQGQNRGNNAHSDQHAAPVDTVLQCLKSAVASCETLVNCQACSVRPECVMLSISICNIMLSSVEELAGTGSQCTAPLAAPTANVAFGGGDTTTSVARGSDQISTHATGKLNGGARSQQFRRGSDLSSYLRGTGTGLKIGKWRLDNEDEEQVIQSLLIARMTRLDGLTTKIQRAVQLNEWPAHDARIRSLRERLVTAIFMTRRRSLS